MNIYDYFLILVVVIKFFVFIFEIYLHHYKKQKDIDIAYLDKLERINQKLLVISQGLMFSLFIFIFRPRGGQVVVGQHEKLIFFALGLIGLTHLDYKVLSR